MKRARSVLPCSPPPRSGLRSAALPYVYYVSLLVIIYLVQVDAISNDCTFGGTGKGKYIVSIPGCKLGGMISVNQSNAIMKVYSGSSGKVAIVERDPDCIPTANDGGKCRLFKVTAGGSLHLSHIHLRGGKVSTEFCTSKAQCSGGLVFVHGSHSSLRAVNSVFGTGALALPPTTKTAHSGAAIYARGGAHVILEKSKIIGNWADSEGGGLGLYYRSTATVLHSTLAANIVSSVNGRTFPSAGGAISVVYRSTIYVMNSTIVNNSAPQGGGVGLRYGCTWSSLAKYVCNKAIFFASDVRDNGDGGDIHFVSEGNTNENKTALLFLYNMPYELTISGGVTPASTCTLGHYCTSLIGRTVCSSSGEPYTLSARLACSGECASNWYGNNASLFCKTCPEGKSNDGTGLTDVSQCLGPPSSLSVLVASNDSLRVEVGHPEDGKLFPNITHYRTRLCPGFGEQLLRHGDFEGEGTDTAWSTFNSPNNTLDDEIVSKSRTGHKSMSIKTTKQGGREQNGISVTPGETLRFSAWWLVESIVDDKGDYCEVSWGQASVRISEWPSRAILSNFSVSPTALNAWLQGEKEFIVPDDVNQITIALLGRSDLNGCTISLLFDDVQILRRFGNCTTESITVETPVEFPGASPGTISTGVETMPALHAGVYSYSADMETCNSFGCSENSITASTSPSCYPPHAYLKNGLCWACPHGQMSTSINGTFCEYFPSVEPTRLVSEPVTVMQPDGPAVRVNATIPRNVSDNRDNTTHAVMRIFHIKNAETERLLAQTIQLGNMQNSLTGDEVLVHREIVVAPPGSGNWSFEVLVNTNHTFVGAIPLRAEVRACSGVADSGYCGEPVAIDVPLVYSISQPPQPILQQFESYNLNVTLRAPAFRGAGVPVLVFEDDAYYELRYRLVNSTQMVTQNVSAGSHQFVILHNLLGKPKQYECQVLLHLVNRTSPASIWSVNATTAESPRVPSLAGITPTEARVTENSVALNLHSANWTGAEPLYYQMEWFPVPECGERNFASDTVAKEWVNTSQPLTVLLEPETEYTLRIRIVAEVAGQLKIGEPSKHIRVRTRKPVTQRRISGDGNDELCRNLSLPVACRSVGVAFDNQYNDLTYHISNGTFHIHRSLSFWRTNVGLNGTGTRHTVLLCEASPCVNIKGYDVPSFLSGITFRKNANFSIIGILADSVSLTLSVRDCAFENFDGAILLNNIQTKVKLVRVTFRKNVAFNGAAMSINSCTNVIAARCLFDQNIATSRGGAIHLASAQASTQMVIEDSAFIGNSATIGGAVFADRNTILKVHQTNMMNNKAEYGGGAIMANSASLDLMYVLMNSTQAQSAFQCTASLIRMQNVSVQHSNGPGLFGSFCDAHILNGLFKNNAGGIQLASKSDLSIQRSSFSENEAVHDGGAISCTDCSSVHVHNSIFENNVAPRGGAVAVMNTPSTLNATIIKNKAENGGGGGYSGLVRSLTGMVTLTGTPLSMAMTLPLIQKHVSFKESDM